MSFHRTLVTLLLVASTSHADMWATHAGQMTHGVGNGPVRPAPGVASEPAGAVHSWEAFNPAACPTVGDATNMTAPWPSNGTAGEALVVNGTPQCNQDGSDWYVAFDGVSDFFTLTDAAMTDMAQPFTWCSELSIANPTSSSFQIFFDADLDTAPDRTQLGKVGNSGGNANKLQFFAGSSAVSTATLTVADQYYCLCAVANGASSRLYIDGAEQTGLSIGSNGLESISVGARASTRNIKFNGRKRFVKLWSGDVGAAAAAWDCGGVH